MPGMEVPIRAQRGRARSALFSRVDRKDFVPFGAFFGTRLKNAPFLKAMSFSMHILLSKKVSKLAPISRSID